MYILNLDEDVVGNVGHDKYVVHNFMNRAYLQN